MAAAARWWTAALDADLSPGAALDDEAWLPLARHNAAHLPAQTRAGDIAARATAHPHSPDALLLLTRLAPPRPVARR
ncbi:hypothetical protein RND61_02705 [Streptomyces sp. TRM76323]|uniref:Uncharacterized protein n=1 Tax=Streptomyces tamarix TaxID=3078565 RepID=A0ABU3QE09_9ACTN|nr:hypothetical protein [Streptomyces tamarix]MDT9681000.1 hypothetical protein [Streptomyces tamarix]